MLLFERKLHEVGDAFETPLGAVITFDHFVGMRDNVLSDILLFPGCVGVLADFIELAFLKIGAIRFDGG